MHEHFKKYGYDYWDGIENLAMGYRYIEVIRLI